MRIDPANVALQARIRTRSVLAALLVQIAVVVPLALVRRARLHGIALVTVRTQANLPMIGHFANGIPTTGCVVFARISAQFVGAGFVVGTVAVGPTSGHAGPVLTDLALRAVVLGGAFGAALLVAADLAATALGVRSAGVRAVADLVALAETVAASRRFHAGDQRVAQEVGRATALGEVVRYFALRATSARYLPVAGI